MTMHPIRRALLSTREQLVDALQIPFSEEQLDAITAPLEPAVVIAGAGIQGYEFAVRRLATLLG